MVLSCYQYDLRLWYVSDDVTEVNNFFFLPVLISENYLKNYIIQYLPSPFLISYPE